MRAASAQMRCMGMNKSGQPCGGYKARGTDFCMSHGDAINRPPREYIVVGLPTEDSK